MLEIKIKSLDGIADAARQFVDAMGENKVFAMFGPMGVGKTTFVKAVCEILGVEDTITSPTFAIVNQYEGDRTIFHFDMYRIERVEEALDFGCEEYFASGELCLVEWPEKIEPLLPEDTMVVRIEIKSDTERRFVIR